MKVLVVLAMLVCAASAKSMNVGTFSFSSCNADARIQVTNLVVSPDPILLPGTVTVDITVAGTGPDVVSPTDFNVAIQKDVDGSWVDIPCVGSLGSCDYPDVCSNLAKRFPDGANCPDKVVASGLNCNCPISAGTYTITGLEVEITIAPPESITDGDYHVQVTAADASGEQLTCLDIYATLEVVTAA